MTSKEIREAFLRFFREKGHEIVKSSPLVPHDDPTLLFTNAGMVQFKGVFLGREERPYSRAASCQKCMRAGGKHSDLENVGHTARHHTFFEMLGNFSFGDYFKEDAIRFSWELLTDWFKLPTDRLWVSIYEEDDEAESLWKNLTDMSPSRIVRLGAADNFWQMGDTGPCGPCSEIIIDQGELAGCGTKDCGIGCNCNRFLELWNLVFMQFNRDESGTLTPLPKPSIDTGMGLERISSVLQGKTNNFDTDLFQPIIEEITSLSGIGYGSSRTSDASIRVIADHIRAATFLLGEALVPSNEGRGYVLRRIIRRASRHARLLGMHEPCLYSLVDSVVSVMGEIYPEISDEQERAEKLLRIEEERFTRTIEQGMNILDDIIRKVKEEGGTSVPGGEVFRLYDTYGFPPDLARDIAMDEGLKVDEDGFRAEMELQRQRARAGAEAFSDRTYRTYRTYEETEFVGYNTLKTEAVIKVIIKEGASLRELKEGEEGEIILDRTPFYGESGGQAGDTGTMDSAGAHMTVIDTKKPAPGHILHRVRVRRGTVRTGDTVISIVDKEKRRATMRNHTATHLLHKALRTVLGDHVKQSGSMVNPERLRFDFTHFYAVQPKEITMIEDLVNEKILENLPVRTSVMSLDEAIREGTIALFDEKYGETVRVVSVEGFSKELCGGTHCSATGDIGLFIVTSEGSVASGIRRIEALTGRGAFEYLRERRGEVDSLKMLLKTDKPVERTERLIQEMKAMEKEMERLKTGASRDIVTDALRDARDINGVKVVTLKEPGLNQKELRMVADNLRERLKSGIIIVTSVTDGQASLVCMVTPDLKDRYNAGEIVRRITTMAGGKGGGRADMAQGGSREVEKLDNAVQNVYDIIRDLN